MRQIITRQHKDAHAVYFDVEERWNRDILEEWCAEQFGLIGMHWWNDVEAEWNGTEVVERFVFYFVNEEDATLFALKWV